MILNMLLSNKTIFKMISWISLYSQSPKKKANQEEFLKENKSNKNLSLPGMTFINSQWNIR